MAQEEEQLLDKHKALSSNTSTNKKIKIKKMLIHVSI
jgi:hypothetical protein